MTFQQDSGRIRQIDNVGIPENESDLHAVTEQKNWQDHHPLDELGGVCELVEAYRREREGRDIVP